jgi:DNA-binding transcriptional regulator YhcF (GntR family)
MKQLEPTIQIDLDSSVPNYKQIADSLRTHLVEGALAPGDVLPSVRRLALELGITFNTVALAYRQLAQEGWLDLKHGRRAKVLDRKTRSGVSRKRVLGFQQRIREMVAQIQAEGLSATEIARELRLVVERLEA